MKKELKRFQPVPAAIITVLVVVLACIGAFAIVGRNARKTTSFLITGAGSDIAAVMESIYGNADGFRTMDGGLGQTAGEAGNKGLDTALQDVTWNDYYDVGDGSPTILYFLLGNGEVITVETEYIPSIVRDIVYRDITGDGTDEVLVYRYFANTATEYTLIDFFEMDGGCVTDISPQTELEELSDNVWNMEWMDSLEKEYGMPVLKMESYAKESGMAYLDECLLVGYQDGRWEIIQE